jgi:threonine dehydratase
MSGNHPETETVASRLVADEPGAAAAVAALISGAYRPAPRERVAVLLCGANTKAADFDRAS